MIAALVPPLRARLGQLIRYGTVSLVATTTSLTVLGVLVATRTTSAGWANLIATAIGTVPSFELNRRWVWGKQGRRSLHKEVAPFTILSFAGLALSTLTVTATASWADAAGLANTTRTMLVELANLSAFGLLWGLQFLILDRVLFRSQPSTLDLTTGEGPELAQGGDDRPSDDDLHLVA